MEEKIVFENAQQMHQKHPRKFRLPEQGELGNLKPGDSVKLGAFGLQFWAIITEIEEGKITARVDSKLKTRHLNYNQVISFGPENVFGIVTEEELAKALASTRTKLGDDTPARRRKQIFTGDGTKGNIKQGNGQKSSFIIDLSSAVQKPACNGSSVEETKRYLGQVDSGEKNKPVYPKPSEAKEKKLSKTGKRKQK